MALYAIVDDRGEIRALQHLHTAAAARDWHRQGTITTTHRLAEIMPSAEHGDIVSCCGEGPEGILRAEVTRRR